MSLLGRRHLRPANSNRHRGNLGNSNNNRHNSNRLANDDPPGFRKLAEEMDLGLDSLRAKDYPQR